jgi:general secretion pathway protein H
MQTLAAGSKPLPATVNGFTLLELLVVVALIAIATAVVSLSLRDSAQSALERDAQRLASLLETARTHARANGVPAQWHTTSQGFAFEGLPRSSLPTKWLADTTRASVEAPIVLGPEPLIGPQAVALSHSAHTGRNLWVVTDGLRPFAVQSTPYNPALAQRQP